MRILDDERSSLGVRYAAAQALGGSAGRRRQPAATAALTEAAAGHPFESIRHLARTCCRIHGMRLHRPPRGAARIRNRPTRQSETDPTRVRQNWKPSCFSRATT